MADNFSNEDILSKINKALSDRSDDALRSSRHLGRETSNRKDDIVHRRLVDNKKVIREITAELEKQDKLSEKERARLEKRLRSEYSYRKSLKDELHEAEK